MNGFERIFFCFTAFFSYYGKKRLLLLRVVLQLTTDDGLAERISLGCLVLVSVSVSVSIFSYSFVLVVCFILLLAGRLALEEVKCRVE